MKVCGLKIGEIISIQKALEHNGGCDSEEQSESDLTDISLMHSLSTASDQFPSIDMDVEEGNQVYYKHKAIILWFQTIFTQLRDEEPL